MIHSYYVRQFKKLAAIPQNRGTVELLITICHLREPHSSSSAKWAEVGRSPSSSQSGLLVPQSGLLTSTPAPRLAGASCPLMHPWSGRLQSQLHPSTFPSKCQFLLLAFLNENLIRLLSLIKIPQKLPKTPECKCRAWSMGHTPIAQQGPHLDQPSPEADPRGWLGSSGLGLQNEGSDIQAMCRWAGEPQGPRTHLASSYPYIWIWSSCALGTHLPTPSPRRPSTFDRHWVPRIFPSSPILGISLSTTVSDTFPVGSQVSLAILLPMPPYVPYLSTPTGSSW